MAIARKILRTWSALCLALVVYAATPHVHSDSERLGGPAPVDARAIQDGSPSESTGGLLPDDAHESHSASASLDLHPCTLCRENAVRTFAVASAAPPLPVASTALRTDLVVVPTRAELLLARRHPARAPPQV